MNRLFLKFAASYGHTWRSLYKSDTCLQFTKQEWSKRLSTFDDITLDAAFDQCMDVCMYPPTLPHFIEQCKSIKKRALENQPKPEIPQPSSLEVAETYLQKIRSLLNMPSKSQGDTSC